MSPEDVRVNSNNPHALSIKYIWLELIYSGSRWIRFQQTERAQGFLSLTLTLLYKSFAVHTRMKERKTPSTRAGEEKWPQQAWGVLRCRGRECVTQQGWAWASETDTSRSVRKREPRLTLWNKYSSRLSAVIISDCPIEDIPQGHFCAHDPCKNSFHDFSSFECCHIHIN